MGYFVRILSDCDNKVSIDFIEKYLEKVNCKAKLIVENGTNKKWDSISITTLNDIEVSILERNIVKHGLHGHEELYEFIDEIDNCKPKSAVVWLKNYLPSVKVIYSFQILDSINEENGWEIVNSIKACLWNEIGGIFQADNEGFTNVDGYHILWQFSESVKGFWYMGIIDNKGNWIHFKMNLGNKNHRESFLLGKIPKGVELVK